MDKRQTNNCEICGELFTDLPLDEECSCSKRKDAAFYVNSDGGEFVWNPKLNEDEGEKHEYYVVRNGEMRIKATDGKGRDYVLRYTEDLEAFGITTDEQLYEASMDEENFYWDMNSWFEVCCDFDEAYSDVFDDLDRAIAEAVRLRKEGH
jgi:hypothetical protein